MRIRILGILFFTIFLYTSCSDDNNDNTVKEPAIAELEISTSEASEVFENSAKLTGTILEDNDLQVSYAYFEFWKGDETPAKVSADVDADGKFSEVINGLAADTEYKFKAVVQFSDNQIISGGVKLFTTLPASTKTSLVLFVNKNASDGGDGDSWDSAYNSINNALDNAVAKIVDDVERVEIWVAANTYDFSTSSMMLRNNVAIYGGFSGSEEAIEDRNYENNITILDGGEVNRVIVNEYTKENLLNNSAILDGFTIQNGRGEGVEGGAMYNLFASPSIANCTFKNNSTSGRGGAIVSYINLNEGETLNVDPLQFTNCNFINNSASGDGGALYTNHRTHLDGGKFENNSSPWGGAVYPSKTEFYATNVLFENNHGHNRGGAFYAQGMVNLKLTSCTFIGNYTSNTGSEFGGGALFFDNGHNEIIKCTFDGNKTTGNGGALFSSWNSCELIVEETEIKNNESVDGGGIYANVISKLKIDKETIISENKASGNGGGIYAMAFGSTVSDFTFLKVANNTAKIGGGIYLSEHSYTFLNVSIQNNDATEKGDGLYLNNAIVAAISGNCFNNDSCASEGTGVCPDFSQCN